MTERPMMRAIIEIVHCRDCPQRGTEGVPDTDLPPCEDYREFCEAMAETSNRLTSASALVPCRESEGRDVMHVTQAVKMYRDHLDSHGGEFFYDGMNVPGRMLDALQAMADACVRARKLLRDRPEDLEFRLRECMDLMHDSQFPEVRP